MPWFIAAALEGDHLDHLPEIARMCGRRPVGAVRWFDGWGPVAPLAKVADNLAASVSGNWTVLVDDGEVTGRVFDHCEVAAALVDRFGSRVVAGFAYSVTEICGYRVHSPGGGLRSVIVQEHEVEPLRESACVRAQCGSARLVRGGEIVAEPASRALPRCDSWSRVSAWSEPATRRAPPRDRWGAVRAGRGGEEAARACGGKNAVGGG